ncbi:uncharacterized protein EAF01_011103 [Botrytis porri]|uniref:Uncharacterized protein n=1 Tax=Botrytis porri TaxID=87229 RepID=A0A4Z1KRT4_9HELO|nr:uncharacterized protein EAF01_011103 [Botrytis porri]KAF7887949.1 hypothetical protein EAF01_011103 [Botrytis porri]TGO84899.1 hypothetical protein BPOR_0453g00090 [Botrytis porri]
MSTNTSQLLDSHESSPISYTPEDSGSDTSNTGTQSPVVLDTVSKLRVRNAELRDKNTELRAQNIQLQEKNTQLQNKNTQLEDKNTQLQNKNIDLRIQNAQLQAEVEKHIAISKMRERLLLPVKEVQQDKQGCKWHFWIICALIIFVR